MKTLYRLLALAVALGAIAFFATGSRCKCWAKSGQVITGTTDTPHR